MYSDLTSTTSLLTAINVDAANIIGPSRRYPIRLIFTNNLSQYKEIVIQLCSIVSNQVDLSLHCRSETLPTKQDILSLIDEQLKFNSSVIFPASEVLRFYKENEFKSFFNYLMDSLENPPGENHRIYIPLYGVWTPFQSLVMKTFSRKSQWAPIWKLHNNSISTSEIYRISFPLSDHSGFVSGFQEWLTLWKSDSVSKYYSSSKQLNYLAKQFLPDEVFICSQDIENYRELIKIALHVSIPFPYQDDEYDHWETLYNLFRKTNNSLALFDIDDFMSKRYKYSLMDRSLTAFIDVFYSRDTMFDRWLLARWFASLCDDSVQLSVFKQCLDGLTTFTNDEIISILWMSPFNISTDKKWLKVRCEILVYAYCRVFYQKRSFEEIMSGLLESYASIVHRNPHILVGVLDVETTFVLNYVRSNPEFVNTEVFKSRFSDLWEYTNWKSIDPDISVNNPWIIEYFNAYCQGKLLWKNQSAIIDMLNVCNKDEVSFYEWYYSHPQVSIPKGYQKIWVDGLGAEWIPLIISLLRKFDIEHKWFIESMKLVRVSLPSTTEINRIEGADIIRDLDVYNHSNIISNNLSQVLMGQIEIIKLIVKQIIASQGDKVAVVSDHGSSYLCIKEFEENKGLGLDDAHHGGRYLWLKEGDDYKTDENKFVHEVETSDRKNKKCLVALKHVSLSSRSPYEVHGGATPEEVVTPLILLKRTQPKKIVVNPMICNDVTTNVPDISFSITPSPESTPYIQIQENCYNLVYKEGSWTCSIKGTKPGIYDAKMTIDGQIVTIHISVKSGVVQEDLF